MFDVIKYANLLGIVLKSIYCPKRMERRVLGMSSAECVEYKLL